MFLKKLFYRFGGSFKNFTLHFLSGKLPAIFNVNRKSFFLVRKLKQVNYFYFKKLRKAG